MKVFVNALVGIALGLVAVLALGYADMRISASMDGVRLDPVSNEVVWVIGPQVPVWWLLGGAVAGALVAATLILGVLKGTRAAGTALAIGFGVSALTLVVVSYTVWPIGVEAFVQDGAIPYGGGWQGWVEHGGRNAAVQLLAAVAVALPLIKLAVERSRHSEAAAGSEIVTEVP
ncbi:hypothetical protein [Demequina flava]|uniref:hypothetical protein n=1 Tax=Demequina flava TaxID=1095025 RepID=UPI0007866046|nr:hypothetical protein [Demequina flava]